MTHTHKNVQIISMLQMRRNAQAMRAGLQKGITYLLLYRGKPIAEIRPVSKGALDAFFSDRAQETGSERIRRNVSKRRKKRLERRR